MNRYTYLSSILLLLPAVLRSQGDVTQGDVTQGDIAKDAAVQADPSAVAKEVKKLHRLLGNWSGSGHAKHAADGEASAWTAVTKCETVLGGHWVREIIKIDMGEASPAPLVFKTFYGWDKESKKYMSYGISNMGKAEMTQLSWENDDTLISVSTHMEQGKCVVERWVWNFTKEGYRVTGHRAVGSGPFFEHVTGTFKKSKSIRGDAVDASKPVAVAFVPVAEAMGKIKGMAGTYRMKGQMCPAPGQPMMDISATEVISFTMGGTILESKVNGDPTPAMDNFKYEGWGAYAWNAQKNCYDIIWLSNMGEGGMFDCRLSGKNKLIMTASRLMNGQPIVDRTIISLADDGSVTGVLGHSITAANDPVISFKATYKKQ